MADTLDTKLVDKRVAHRYLQKGRLDRKEYEAYLKKLADLADRAVPVEAEIPRGSADPGDEE